MRRRLPPLNALRAFEAAGRLGRMTAAAEEMSVSPGAISRQVQQLERSLDMPLFEGSKNRPRLTDAGSKLLPVLSAAFQHIEDAVREISDGDRGPLDVACFSTFTVKWLIPRLFDFSARHPDIEVRLRTTDASGGQAPCDLAIAVDEAVHGEDASVLPLFCEWLGPVLAPSLARQLALKRPADLAGQVLLHTRTRRNAWDMWRTAAKTAPAATTGAEFEHYYFTLEAAVRGLGIAVAPWHLVMDDLESGRLVAPFGFRLSGYRYVAQRRTARSHPRLDVFCDWLATQARAMPEPIPAVRGRPAVIAKI